MADKTKKTILVTGGAGFIGSHLCECLLEKGHKVVCLDNFYSGSEDNIRHLLTNPDFEFIKQDVTEPFYYQADEIYNLACPASPISYQFDPVFTIRTNILGALNMLELARKTSARILQASTSEIYGNPLKHPQKETYWGNVDALSPRACYDEGKRAAEALFFDYYREHKVDIRIVRIFNTYGPKMALNDGRVISNFIRQSLSNEEITVYGRGSQTRSFMYIDDLIEGMVKMMDKPNFPGPINLGNPNEISIRKLAQMIIKLTKSHSKVVNLSPLENDPKRRLPDISLAKKELNWQPKIDFETGLVKTIEYFRERLKDKTNILVFSTVYFPSLAKMDEAEENFRNLIKEMPSFHFHIITSRWDKKLPKIHNEENFTIYRIGMGSKLDKYLLVLLGPFQAKKLHKDKKFVLTSSVRATYGSLASLIFKILSNVPFVIMMHPHDLDDTTLKKIRKIRPVYKLLFKKSEAIHSPDDRLIQGLKDFKKDSEMDLFSVESTQEVRKLKEAHHKIINKLGKKLVKPR